MLHFIYVIDAVAVGVEWLARQHFPNAIKGCAIGPSRRRIHQFWQPTVDRPKSDWCADVRDRGAAVENIIGLRPNWSERDVQATVCVNGLSNESKAENRVRRRSPIRVAAKLFRQDTICVTEWPKFA